MNDAMRARLHGRAETLMRSQSEIEPLGGVKAAVAAAESIVCPCGLAIGARMPLSGSSNKHPIYAIEPTGDVCAPCREALESALQ